MQTMIERIVLTNESSTDKNFAFYVPRDDNRFKLVLVPGYGALKPGEEMTVEVQFTLLMTTTIERKVKFEVLGMKQHMSQRSSLSLTSLFTSICPCLSLYTLSPFFYLIIICRIRRTRNFPEARWRCLDQVRSK